MITTQAIKYLFPETSRQATPSAPPFDPTKNVKSWVDPNPTTGSYFVLDPNGKVISLTLPIAEASTLNLPGHPDYAVYVAAPTRSVFAGSGNPLPFGVSNLADAENFAKIFGLGNDSIFDEMGSFPGETVAYDPSDPRRCYGIKLANGSFADVATLLKQQNANGVGAPGEWKQDASGNWSWTSELAPDPVNPVVTPQPIVPLTAGEQISMGPFGPVLVVDDGASTAPAGGTGGGLQPDERAIVLRMGAWLGKVGG